MGATTTIGWTSRRNKAGNLVSGATYNPWIGCTKVGPECLNCYAERFDHQRNWTPDGWGKGKPRYFTGETSLNAIRTLNRKSHKEGFRRAVFCASLGDVFDPEVEDSKRDELFDTISRLNSLEWLLLTKRPEEAARYLAGIRAWPEHYPHVRLGVSAGTVATWRKQWQALVEVPAFSRFVSVGPLLEDLRICDLLGETPDHPDWIIVEGESCDDRTRARPMDPTWVRNIRTACWLWGIPFFFKQWGEWCPLNQLDHNPQAQGIIAAGGDVPCHTFQETGEKVWCVGTRIANNYLDGKRIMGLPRPIPLATIENQTTLL